MNSAGILHSMKRALPFRFIRILARGREYLRRVSAWGRVVRELKGRTRNDRLIFWRSLARASVDLLYDLDRWREPSLDADAEIVSRELGVFPVRRRTDDLGNILPSYFLELFDCIRQFVHEGDTTIDAGANLGAVSVFMSRLVGPRGRVIAVEMMPDTAKMLRRTLALNGLTNVDLFELALADRTGDTLVARVEPGFHGQASTTQKNGGNPRDREVEVLTITLEELMKGVQEVALLKLDLEGTEPQALRGAGDAINRIRAILFESWTADGGDAARLLRDVGFEINAIDGRNFIAQRR